MRSFGWLFFIALAGCASPGVSVCGEGEGVSVGTGLRGVIDDTPAVEIVLRDRTSCALVDTHWMLWDDEAEVVTLTEEPTGTLDTSAATVGDRTILFNMRNLGVRLEFPGDAGAASELGLVWFSAGTDLARVDCAGVDRALACELAP